MKKKKRETINEYLKKEMNKELDFLLGGYSLKKIPIDLFFKTFDQVERTPQKVAEYICSSLLNDEIGYQLAVFGERTCELLNKDNNKYSTKLNSTGINYDINDEDYYYNNYFR